MNSITILGSGRVGSALATALAEKGVADVVVGVRSPDSVRATWSGPAVTFLDVSAAIGRSDLIVNATPGDTSLERLTALKTELVGKTLVDISNATTRSNDGMPGGLLYPGSSLGERLQAALPRTAVVKTLNTMLFTVMTAPAALSSPPTVFVSGDDSAAKVQVIELLADLGWDAQRIIDLGDIETARGTEALAVLVPSLLKTLGFIPFAISIAR
ncbi:NADPH-dependent F420 reductase [Rhodococcoides yunnanense]|uniref:NAD(P)-binding domain-containing protein n=1 Tax=Rhodococcoides yunnanense TaxID=278209 RepID=A0ABU4BIE1_9NOCA|nr:NAD(P)-binding domain-containing protein [Rhodococcus yunnanensis]MDV6263974.1 NAD(P)-binding domain-containing protein [Rhodococcus yunnanensis]